MPDLPITGLPLATTDEGGEVVAVVQGGVTKQAEGPVARRIVNAQRAFQIDVTDEEYGATGDGSTDDSAAFLAAVAAATPGAEIYVPPGTYMLRNIAVNKDGITFRGVRGKSILKYRATGAGSSDALMTWNHTTAPGTNNTGITIRDLTFLGTAPSLGSLLALEHQYLLQLSAVTDVLIDNCDFLEFQGDGIYLGRTTTGGSDTGVHNHRVTIRDCYFYGGTTYFNRDGISVIDGTAVEIKGNTFENCGLCGIDVEPNSWDTTAVLRAFTVADNVFLNTGVTADLQLAITTATAVDIFGWKVTGNRSFGCRGKAFKFEWNNRAAVAGDAFMGIVVSDNQVHTAHASATDMAVVLEGVRGVTFDNNVFTGWPLGAIRAGYDAIRAVRDIKIRNCTFIDCGGASAQYAVMANVVNGLHVQGNHLQRTSGTQTAFLVMQTGPVDNARVFDNTTDGSAGVVLSYSATTNTLTQNWAYGNKAGWTSTVPEPIGFFGQVEKFGPQRPRVRTSTPYSMSRDDDVVFMNVASATCSLPDPSQSAQGRRYFVGNMHSSACTVNSQGTSKTINGLASLTLNQGQHVTVVTPDNLQWYTVEDPLWAVDLFNAQTVAGIKTFSASPIVPTPTTAFQAATKGYVDSATTGDGWSIVRPPWATQATGLITIANASSCWYYRVVGAATISKVKLYVGTSSGNVCVAAYSNTGSGLAAAPGAQLATSGSLACPTGSAVAEVSLGASVALNAGDWLAIACDNTTATFGGLNGLGGSGLTAGMVGQQTSAFPCPATPGTISYLNNRLITLIGVP